MSFGGLFQEEFYCDPMICRIKIKFQIFAGPAGKKKIEPWREYMQVKPFNNLSIG